MHRVDRGCKDFLWPQGYCLRHKCKDDTEYLAIPGIDYHYKHFEPQAQCVLTDTLKPAVDYLGTTETLEEDVSNIIDELNRRKDENLPPLIKEIVRRNANSDRERLEKRGESLDENFYKTRKDCLNSVNHVYNKDFMLLGYEKIET